MDLNKLKSTWQNAGGETKSQSELQRMTQIKNHPHVRRTKVKFIIEVTLLVVLLVVYYDIFNGAEKPQWVNIMFASSIVLYIITNVIGYMTLLNPVQGDNVTKSLRNLKVKLQRVLIISLIASTGFAISLILFFTFNIHFTVSKYALLSGMLLTLVIVIFFSYKTWMSRVSRINQSALEFSEV